MYGSRVKERERRERMLRDFKLGVFSMFVLVILVVSFCWDRQTLPDPVRPDSAATQNVRVVFGPPPANGTSSAAITHPADPPPGPRGASGGAHVDPAPSPPPERPQPEVRMVRYRLRRNDTLVKLARRYYAGDWEKWTLIRDANPGIKPKKLRVGRVIKIPVTVRRAGTALAAAPG